MARSGRSYPNRPVVVRAPTPPLQLNQAAEDDIALPVLAARSRVAGQAGDTSAALPVVAAKTWTIGQAIDTSTARPVLASKMRQAGQASETNTARTVQASKVRAIGLPVETDSARIIRSDPVADLAVESDVALPVRPVKVRPIGLAIDIGQARPLTHALGGPIGLAVETGTARPLRSAKARPIGRAAETTEAHPMLRRTPPLRVGLPTRAWSARYIGRGTLVEPMSSLSLEYLRFFVANAIGSEQVEIAFTTPGIEPAEGQWQPASWGRVARDGAEARVRVGPGGAVALTDGTYQGWVRVTRPDERPVLSSGLVPIT